MHHELALHAAAHAAALFGRFGGVTAAPEHDAILGAQYEGPMAAAPPLEA